MKNTVITINDFNFKNGNVFTTHSREFHGIIPGYVCGFHVEAVKDGKTDCGSCCFTNDFENTWDPDFHRGWNDLGISANCMRMNGWDPTGNIIFHGYFEEHWDFEERDWYYIDKTEEVEELFSKYIVA